MTGVPQVAVDISQAAQRAALTLAVADLAEYSQPLLVVVDGPREFLELPVDIPQAPSVRPSPFRSPISQKIASP